MGLDQEFEDKLILVRYLGVIRSLARTLTKPILFQAIKQEFDVEIDQEVQNRIEKAGLMDENQAVEWVASNLTPLDVFGEPERR